MSTIGEIVWAKAPGYTWWPAQIWAPDAAAKPMKDGTTVVFLDDGSWTNISSKSTMDFVDHYEKKMKTVVPADKHTKARFFKAVVKARQLTEMTGWVQCDKCAKWRKFPASVPAVGEKWVCSDNTWDKYRACSVPEEDGSLVVPARAGKKGGGQKRPASKPAGGGGAAAAKSQKKPRPAAAATAAGSQAAWGGLTVEIENRDGEGGTPEVWPVRITRDFPPAVMLADFVAMACRQPIEEVAKLAFVIQYGMRTGTVRQVDGAAVVDAPYMGQVRKLLPADVQTRLEESGDEVALFNAVFDNQEVRGAAEKAGALEWPTSWPEVHDGPPRPGCKCSFCASCAKQPAA
eukprot:SAG22_NODE_2834_length_2167_cov_1.551474_1_plen_345_part_01